MMSLKIVSLLFVGWFIILNSKTTQAADVLVQLNVNRPLTDVNEKFVNFAIKPEELYRALDGDNRRIITRMAAMLGESYIKFTNDYDFAMNSEMKLRNPTKIIWKGFNRWARAVNWTMIVPLPYDPETWDPMETLRILNSSYLAGMTECVWQLGTDFGESHAEDYTAELRTLNMMVESFKPYVDDWRIMGADISAGSSAEETRRYVELSKDLNAAYGWTQGSQSSNPMASLPNDDPALRMLIRQKVPVWLALPQKAKSKPSQAVASDEATEALNWAKILGEAASSGYDAVFRRITAADLERPSFSYYVSALFKKVMGSRVFHARPLNAFSRTNKLYTHCANTVSGGIAFMIVNANDQPLHVQIRSLSKISTTEVWQYALTMKKSTTLLNGERLWYNATLRPLKTHKQPNKAIQLSTPARSVSFWVLPDVDIDHCQYTEIMDDQEQADSSEEQKIVKKRYSSSDKLLLKLIQETSVPNNPIVRAMNRGRRFARTPNSSSRSKRFLLKDKSSKPGKAWAPLFRPIADLKNVDVAVEPKASVLTKREHVLAKPELPVNPLNWFKNLMENPMTADLPQLLRRGVRSIDNDFLDPLLPFGDTLRSATGLEALFRPLADLRNDEIKMEPKRSVVKKREPDSRPEDSPLNSFDWLTNVMRNTMASDAMQPLLSRRVRSIDDDDDDDYFGPTFATKDGKRTSAFTKKITEIKQPEQDVRPLFEMDEFDEEEFFKKLENYREPAYPRLPDGDVILQLITNPDGEEVDDMVEERDSKSNKPRSAEQSQEIESEMKPIKLLPTELYESIPAKPHSFDDDLNKFLFPDAFSKKPSKHKKVLSIENELKPAFKITSSQNTQLANDFIRTQKELLKSFGEDGDKNDSEKNEKKDEESLEKNEMNSTLKPMTETTTTDKSVDNESGMIMKPNPRHDHHENFFGEIDESNNGKQKFDELPWWDLDVLKQQQQKRKRRALYYALPDDDDLHTNLISKDGELMPLGAGIPPEQLVINEKRILDKFNKIVEEEQTTTTIAPAEKNRKEHKFVATFKEKVSSLVDIVARQVSDWYDTFTRHIDSAKKADNSTKVVENKVN